MRLAYLGSMERVIAEYTELGLAEHAVRSLESQGLSIQDIYITDQSQRKWRTLHRKDGHSIDDAQGFVVVMRGRSEDLERARTLLAAAGTKEPKSEST